MITIQGIQRTEEIKGSEYRQKQTNYSSQQEKNNKTQVTHFKKRFGI